jgi:hypothetical protein
MLTCSTGKRVYETLETAETALMDAYGKFNRGPIAVYKCDDCGYWHFTSREPMNEKLSAAIASGKIKAQQRANDWIDSFRKKRT